MVNAASPQAPPAPSSEAHSAERARVDCFRRLRPGANWEDLTGARGERFGSQDMRVRGDADKRLDAALRSPTQLEFTDTPLSDVIDYLKDYHGVEIQLDKRILDEAGIGTDIPITRSLKGVSLRSALKLTLKPLGLDYVAANGVILITTKADADKMTPGRSYESSRRASSRRVGASRNPGWKASAA